MTTFHGCADPFYFWLLLTEISWLYSVKSLTTKSKSKDPHNCASFRMDEWLDFFTWMTLTRPLQISALWFTVAIEVTLWTNPSTQPFYDYRTDFFWPNKRADEFLEVQVLQNCPTLFTASGITLPTYVYFLARQNNSITGEKPVLTTL